MLPIVASSQALEHAFTLLAIAKDPKAAEAYLQQFADAAKAHDARVADLREQEKHLDAANADLERNQSLHQGNIIAHLAKVADAERGWADLESQRQSFAAERQKALDAVASQKASVEADRRELAKQTMSYNQAVAAIAAREMAADQRHAAASAREEALTKAEADLAARQAKVTELAKALA